MRPLAAFPLFAVLAACSASETGSPTRTEMISSAESVTVAAWNIEHLAAENGQGCKPRDDADYV